MSELRIAGLIVLAIGTCFLLIGGGLFGLMMPHMANEAIARVEPLTAWRTQGAIRTLPPGSLVLLEGRISEENLPQYEDYIAFVEEAGREDWDATDEDQRRPDIVWRTVRRVTPPLWVALDDGPVRVINEDYGLPNAPMASPRRLVRYSYLRAGDEVLLLGTLQPAEDTPRLEAEWLAWGNKESYLASERGAARAGRIIGGIFGGLGLLAVGIGLALVAKG